MKKQTKYKERPLRLFKAKDGRFYVISKGKKRYLNIPKQYKSVLQAQTYVAKKLRGRRIRPIRQPRQQYDKSAEVLNKSLAVNRLDGMKKKLESDKEKLMRRKAMLEKKLEDAPSHERQAIIDELSAIPYAIGRANVLLKNIDEAQYKTISAGLSDKEKEALRPVDQIQEEVQHGLEEKVIKKPLMIENKPSTPRRKPAKSKMERAAMKREEETKQRLQQASFDDTLTDIKKEIDTLKTNKLPAAEQKEQELRARLEKASEDFKHAQDYDDDATVRQKRIEFTRAHNEHARAVHNLNKLAENKEAEEVPTLPEVPSEQHQQEMLMSFEDFMKDIDKVGSSLSKRNPEHRSGPALWSDEIEDYFKGNKHFAGVFSVDEMKYLPQMDLPFGFVVNMSKASEEGTHWCSVWITPDSIEYYDPTGEDPPKILVNGLKEKLLEWHMPILMKFKVNKIKGQNNSTNNCGYFAIRFLDERMHGTSFAAATRFEQDGELTNMQKKGENAIKSEFKLI